MPSRWRLFSFRCLETPLSCFGFDADSNKGVHLMNIRAFLRSIALLLSLAGLCSCFGSDDGEPADLVVPPTPVLPFADSEDQLMANFKTVYEDMDHDLFKEILHPDFATFLQPRTQVDFPDVGPTLDLATELRSAERMFASIELTDTDGHALAAVLNIEFAIIEQRTAWANTLANDNFPGARSALFDVNFLFSRSDQSTIEVMGQIKFYVAGRDSVHNGVSRTYWEMIGQQDFTGNKNKAVEETPWSSLKALYR